MVVVLYVLSFLWGVVVFPILLAFKKGVERTKTLPMGSTINIVCSVVYSVFTVVAIIGPILLVAIFDSSMAWGETLIFGGMLFYAFLKRDSIKAYVKDVHRQESFHDAPIELASEIIEVGWRCRKCGTPYPYPYDRTSPMYGSPLFVCPKCGLEQADYRRLEPALDRRFGNWNVRQISIKVNVVSLLASVALWVILVNTPYADRMNIYAAMLFFTVQVFVASVIVTIESLLKKKPDFIKKSELRLQNGEYVVQLRKHGIEVPSKY